MMRASFTIVSAAVSALALCGAASAVDFSTVVEDLPIMPGLAETDASFTFETAGGRIARVEATGAAEPESAARFYADTLPQLGWRPAAPGAFERAGERLAVLVSPTEEGGVRVRFELNPGARAEAP